MAAPSSTNGNFFNARRVARGSSAVYCAAAWCNNFGGCRLDEPLSFFRFPKDRAKAKEWAKFSLREDLLWREGSLNNYRLCSEHFREDDYRQTYPRRLLKTEAIPSVSHCGHGSNSCNDRILSSSEFHNVMKDDNGNEKICLDLEELSKDQTSLKDIEIGGELDDSTLGDYFEMMAEFSGEMVLPDEPNGRNLRAWPSGEEVQLLNPSLSLKPDSIGNSLETIKDWSTNSSIKAVPVIDEKDAKHHDEDTPDTTLVCGGREPTICSNEEGTDALRKMLAGCTQENSLVMFFAKAFQVTCSFPHELQNQIKKDMLNSIVKAESQVDRMKSSSHE